MIIVRNRELLIPREEFNIGTNYDTETETREFRLNKVTQGGVDITNLSFNLDIKYANGNTDTACLDKIYPETETEEDTKISDNCDCDTKKVLVIPPFPVPKPPKPLETDYITLVLTVNKNMLQVPGAVLIQIRGYSDDGLVKWSSYQGAFFVESAINTPTTYSGNLTELEQLEVNVTKVLKSEEARAEAETKREEDFKTAIDEFDQNAQKALDDFEQKQIDLTKYANESKSYAVGSTGSREGEDTDNSKYYSEIAKDAENKAKDYMDVTAKYAAATAPDFHVDYDDGHVKYNKASSYDFKIDTESGDIIYSLIGG